MIRLLAVALAAIVLLTAGSMLLVWRLTEDPPTPGPRSAARAVEPALEPAAAPPALAAAQEPVPLDPEPGTSALIVVPVDEASVAGPVPNESPPIQGPAPMALPANPAERQDAQVALRKQRFADQMERLNQRNLSRGGKPGAGVQPKGPPAPGQAPGRRGSLSGSE